MRGVTCGYDGAPVLSGVDLTINRGEFVGLLGPSGSGKTTLLRSLLGALDLFEGEVLVEGQPPTAGGPASATCRSWRRSTGASLSPSSRW